MLPAARRVMNEKGCDSEDRGDIEGRNGVTNDRIWGE